MGENVRQIWNLYSCDLSLITSLFRSISNVQCSVTHLEADISHYTGFSCSQNFASFPKSEIFCKGCWPQTDVFGKIPDSFVSCLRSKCRLFALVKIAPPKLWYFFFFFFFQIEKKKMKKDLIFKHQCGPCVEQGFLAFYGEWRTDKLYGCIKIF